jgi:hypothetical protein
MVRTRYGAVLLKRPRLIAGAGLAVSVVALSLFASGVALASLSALLASSGNSFTAGKVTLSNSSVTGCPVSNLLPNATAATCTFTATYAGPVPAYLAVNILIETQAGTGGTKLFNPSDSTHDLQLTITSSSPSVTYKVPTLTATCPGGAPSGSVCYGLNNELISTSALTSATVAFTVSASLPTTSPTGYQGGAAQILLTTHAVQSGNNTLSCEVTTVGSPCTPQGTFSWS